MEDAIAPGSGGRPVPAPAVLSRGRRTGWYAAAAAVVVAGLAGVTWIGIFETGSQVPAEPMRLVPLTSYPGLEYDPDFSPDGEQVTFSWNGEKQDNFDIYVRPVDSDNPQRLTTHAAVEEHPAWSPDGRWIAFERPERPTEMKTRKSSILLIPSIGGPERKVTVVERAKRSRLAWLPDSTGLIIADGNPSSLFTVSIETGEKRQLTKPPEGMWGDVDPVLSADAHSLAFVRFNGRWSHDAYLLDLDAEFKPLGAATPLTSDSQAFVQAWSPDEQDLIVSRDVGHTWGYLHRVSVAGAPNELRRLDVVGSGVGQAAVSAGRNRMVCVRESKDWDLEVLEKTGAESDSWDPGSFPSSTRLEAGPRYSPDGKWLAFESNRTGPFGIWLSEADGTGAREVWTVENASGGMPRWSPDSQRIAFDTYLNDNFDIYIISSAGGSPLRLTDHPRQDQVPSWSADGRWIYFTSNRSGRFEIWKVSAAGGENRGRSRARVELCRLSLRTANSCIT